MSVRRSAGGVTDVNCTCNVLHVPRASTFTGANATKAIVDAMKLLATGQSIPPVLKQDLPGESGVRWLGSASSDVVACSTNKDIGGVVGVVQLQLKRGAHYIDTVLPGDLLFVFMDDAGGYDLERRQAGTLVMIVVVDRCEMSLHVENGATSESVMVSARDLAVVFSESTTVFDQAFTAIENAMYTGTFYEQVLGEKQTALSPAENVLSLLRLLYDKSLTGSALADLQWKMTATASDTSASSTQLVSMIDILTHVQFPTPYYALAEPPGIVQAGNVWSLLESYSNPVVNEFFIDIRDASPEEARLRAALSSTASPLVSSTDLANQFRLRKSVADSKLFGALTNDDSGDPALPAGAQFPALVLRTRPYDQDAFDALPTIEISSTEVESLRVARSSHDVFNWFRIRFPGFDVKYQELVSKIPINPTSVARFGFRRMEAETRYLFADSQTSADFVSGAARGDFSAVFDSYLRTLTGWYGHNEQWLAGTGSLRFLPALRVGYKLVIRRPDRSYAFYVQAVSHMFSKDPGASRTHVTLVRGVVVGVPLETSDIVYQQHDGFGVGDANDDPPSDPPPNTLGYGIYSAQPGVFSKPGGGT